MQKIIFRGDYAEFESDFSQRAIELKTFRRNEELPLTRNGIPIVYFIKFGGIRCNIVNERGLDSTLYFLSDYLICPPMACHMQEPGAGAYFRLLSARDGMSAYVLPASAVNEVMAKSHAFALAQARHLAELNELLVTRWVLSSYQNSRREVCAFLYLWLQQSRMGNHCEIYQSQEEIAKWCGVSLVHFTRIIAELRSAGIVKTGRRKLIVVNPESLLDFVSN